MTQQSHPAIFLERFNLLHRKRMCQQVIHELRTVGIFIQVNGDHIPRIKIRGKLLKVHSVQIQHSFRQMDAGL